MCVQLQVVLGFVSWKRNIAYYSQSNDISYFITLSEQLVTLLAILLLTPTFFLREELIKGGSSNYWYDNNRRANVIIDSLTNITSINCDILFWKPMLVSLNLWVTSSRDWFGLMWLVRKFWNSPDAETMTGLWEPLVNLSPDRATSAFCAHQACVVELLLAMWDKYRTWVTLIVFQVKKVGVEGNIFQAFFSSLFTCARLRVRHSCLLWCSIKRFHSSMLTFAVAFSRLLRCHALNERLPLL